MAELTPMKNLLDSYLGESSNSEAVTKFMNGEISFGDCLLQMGDPSESTADPLGQIPAKVVSSFDSLSIGTLDDIQLSASSGASCSETDENHDQPEGRRRQKKARTHLHRSKLSATLKALMGQANVCYAQGDAESAVKLCLEIIKEEPNASEPFRTLSNIYEGIGEAEKSLQMRLLAAQLGPTTKDEWIQLATILKGEERFKQAAACYTRAIKYDGTNVALYEDRIEVMRLARLPMPEDYGYQRLLSQLNPKTDGPTVIRVRNLVASSYCKDKKFEKACEILKYIFDNCKELIMKDEIDLYTDALIYAGKYDECLSILCEFCGIYVTERTNDDEVIVHVDICNEIPVDIRIKLAVCLVHLRSYDVARSQTEIFLNDDVNQYCQLLYNMASKLTDDGVYRDALQLLHRLSNTSMNSPDIWFKITFCLKNLDELEECLESYRTAINYFPQDNELKVKFCNELRSAGQYDEAVEITFRDQGNVSLMIYERCQLYYLLAEYDAFIEAAWQLFRLHCIEISSVDEFNFFEALLPRSSRGLKEKLTLRLNKVVDLSVSLNDEWQVFVKVSNIYLQRKDYDLFEHLACSLCLSLKFIPKRYELRLALILACIYNDDYDRGFDITRPLLFQAEIPKRAWNLFYLATRRKFSNRVHRFLIRMLIKNPNDDNALMLYANSSLLSGTYKYALNDYTMLCEKYQTPMLSFMIALNLLHLACQKFTTSKHALVTQMLAFFTKYQEQRGSAANQEIFYNFGRAFHQLELLPQAISYYQKALECKPAVDDPMFDLTPDIGFNLHLIYMRSGQFDLAKTYLEKYVII